MERPCYIIMPPPPTFVTWRTKTGGCGGQSFARRTRQGAADAKLKGYAPSGSTGDDTCAIVLSPIDIFRLQRRFGRLCFYCDIEPSKYMKISNPHRGSTWTTPPFPIIRCRIVRTKLSTDRGKYEFDRVFPKHLELIAYRACQIIWVPVERSNRDPS